MSAGDSAATVPVASTSSTNGGEASGSASSKARGEKGGSARPEQSARKPAKEMTKAERRELQERQREAKAKEKAAAEAAKGKGTGKQQDKSGQSSSSSTKGKQAASASQAGASNVGATVINTVADTSLGNASPLSLFLHLDPPRSAKSLNAKVQRDMIHPSILRLALLYADFKIVGANARCLAMLEAFKDVISSYVVPPGKALVRHLPTHLSPQITHLVRARPMAISMGNAVRYIKWEIQHLPPDMPDEEAKDLLCERIDHFIRDRIVLAGKVIEDLAMSKIKDGDVILAYARSSLVEGVLKLAKDQGKRFSVVVVDSGPMHEGKSLLKALLSYDIACSYVLLSALGSVLPTVSLALLGAAAMLSNGAMFSRAGTASVAMLCKGAGIPVVCCCETYKFSDRIMLDSIVGNELASTASMLPQDTLNGNPNLGVLNFLYDVSRPEDVTAVVTETAIVPVLSVPFVLREHKPINLGG